MAKGLIPPLPVATCAIAACTGVAHASAGDQCAALDAPTVVALNGGDFLMGEDRGYPDEAPVRAATVGAFSIDAFEVTNRRFAAFVDETGYVTVAERVPDPADFPGIPANALAPGSAVFTPPLSNGSPTWWRFTEGASWRTPEGPGSAIDDRMDHPVIHIAYEDAQAFAAWAGGDLPSEAEWEYAARGGLVGARYEWGEEDPHQGEPRANTWQGIFPVVNLEKDGHARTAPVGCFPANGFGLYDMTGNVWEWTKDAYRPGDANSGLIKGGSFLCAENFCQRYRPAAKHEQERNFSASHIGFRLVYRTEENPQ